MQTQLLDKQARPLVQFLQELLPYATSFNIASAFIKSSGWDMIEDSVLKLLSKGNRFEIVFGFDFHISEPGAIRKLLDLKKNSSGNVVCMAFSDYTTQETPNFHPKLYILETEKDFGFSIGSSNLTRGGLLKNVELNLGFSGLTKNAPLAVEVSKVFAGFKENGFEPTEEYISRYEDMYKAVNHKGLEIRNDPSFKKSLITLKQQESSIRKATITQLQLVMQTIRELTKDKQFAHLKDITERAREKAKQFGLKYDWSTFDNSVRAE